jgi:hypothetical protein
MLPSLVAVFVALGVVWLTSQLATRRAHREKLWERRAQAFSIIFEALYDFSSWYDDHMEDEFRHREVDDETQKRRDETYRAAKDRLYRTLAREDWLLSDKVKERLTALTKALDAHHDAWFEMLDDGYRAVSQTKKDLVKIAKSELGQP